MTDTADDSRGEQLAAADDAVALADVALVCEHVRRAAGVLLEEAPTLPKALQQALDDKLNVECIKKFIGDPQTRSLLIERVSAKGGSKHPYKADVFGLSDVELSWRVVSAPTNLCRNGFV